jgi:Ca2+-binding EF-hand superfamily protein
MTKAPASAADDSALKARFDGYDRDGNGRIDAAEFGELLDELGAGYDAPQVSAAFEAVDTDRDGQIEFPEFAEWWVG